LGVDKYNLLTQHNCRAKTITKDAILRGVACIMETENGEIGVLTCAHMVHDASLLAIDTGNVTLVYKTCYVDEQVDLAWIPISHNELTEKTTQKLVRFADFKRPNIGEMFYAASFHEEVQMACGIVCEVSREIIRGNYILDMRTLQGFSGSLVYNGQGFIGIAGGTMWIGPDQLKRKAWTQLIPTDKIRAFLKRYGLCKSTKILLCIEE